MDIGSISTFCFRQIPKLVPNASQSLHAIRFHYALDCGFWTCSIGTYAHFSERSKMRWSRSPQGTHFNSCDKVANAPNINILLLPTLDTLVELYVYT